MSYSPDRPFAMSSPRPAKRRVVGDIKPKVDHSDGSSTCSVEHRIAEYSEKVKRGLAEISPVLEQAFTHVNTEFGGGHYSEKHYQKGLAAELEVHGFSCRLEVMVPLHLNRSDGVACFVGFGYADMLITSPQGHMSLLELKMGTPTDTTIGAAKRQARTYRSHLCENGHDILNTFIVFFPKDCPITNPRLHIMEV